MSNCFIATKEDICEVGKLLYDRGYVVSNDGNISVRTGENEVWITPSGVSKGRMTPDMLIKISLDGEILEGNRYPSSELKMHLMVYRHRPDVGAVVHAHPPASTAFAVCRKPLDRIYMPEVALTLGNVPVTEYAMPSTEDVPRSIAPFLDQGNAVLVANHGVLVWDKDLWSAFNRMEVVEYTAKVYMNVAQIGGGVELTAQEIDDLSGLSAHYSRLAGTRT